MSDRTAFLTVNLSAALVKRTIPTITMWNRLEGRPRTLNFNRALKAEVRDALWMLTKQWQLGEFQGDDAGSPIEAKVRLTQSRLRNYAAAGGAVETFDDAIPLETKVERRPVTFSLELQLLMGRQWLKMLPVPALRSEYIRQYPIHSPDPTSAGDAAICAHQEAWSEFAAHAGRAMNGAAFYQHLKAAGAHAADGIAGSAGHETDLDNAAGRFVTWFETLISPPSGSDAWLPERLEYQFACAAPVAPGVEKVLTAERYYDGHIDWYSTDIASETRLGNPPPDPQNPSTDKRAMIPNPATFSGMPNTRWWAFEDGRTNFGDIKPDTTDLAKLLLIEFGLIYANDWFLIPYTLPAASIVHVDGVAVTNVFGERTWIDPAGSRAGDAWQRWGMFLEDRVAPGPLDTSLVLFPSATKVDDAPPSEEILLIRDEVANMVWAVETTIPLPTGEPKRGLEAARETRAFFEQRLPPPPPPPPPVAPIRYDLMSSVPENWIPFIPVHIDGNDRTIQLQRAAMLRVLDGDTNPPVKVQPRTTLIRAGLDENKPYLLHEEEVPRAGAIVTQRYRRTRWRDGRAWVWIGVRKQTGRGEGSSGLAFDRMLNVTKT